MCVAADAVPSFVDIFALYGAITPAQTYDAFCTQHENKLQTIDERYVLEPLRCLYPVCFGDGHVSKFSAIEKSELADTPRHPFLE
jgi:hypothetical protein